MKLFVRLAVVLGIASALAGVAVVVLRTQRPPEATVAAFLETLVMSSEPAGRAKTLRRVERMLRQASSAGRMRLWQAGLLEGFYAHLEPRERRMFVGSMTPADAAQVAAAFDALPLGKRQELIETAVSASAHSNNMDAAQLKTRILSNGLSAFWKDADVDGRFAALRLFEAVRALPPALGDG